MWHDVTAETPGGKPGDATIMKGRKKDMKNFNSGYCGEWMSKRAKEAINDGKKPWKLWGDKKLKKEIKKENPELDYDLLKSMDAETLKKMFLRYAGWHHMGKDFKEVKFYQVCNRGYTNADLLAAA